ncbi:MAG: ABC transporter permease [Alphaproteobacteria bacterium]|nr:ABC transporter permease [Alphaproteobacteria bacterium]
MSAAPAPTGNGAEAAAIAEDSPAPRRGGLARLVGLFNANWTSWAGLAMLVVIVLMAIFAPLLAPYDPLDQSILNRLKPPSADFLMGTDAFGRDVLSRVLYGARISLIVAIAAIGLAMVAGGTIGLVSGYVGGRFDVAMMQAMDVLMSFPSLILGLVIVALLGPELRNLIVAISLTAVPPFARIARAPTLAVKERAFVEAGRALGFSHARIIFVHILPNVMSEVVVMGTLWLATAVRVEASLSFIGLGVKPPTPTWGGMMRDAFENILDAPWIAIYPGLAILALVFALNLLGDGLRDATDPKLRGE